MKRPVPVLVVDDNPKNLAVIDSVLDSPEYQLVMVQTAQDALQSLLRMEFAAVLLDVKMPVMSGYALARLIKSRKVNRYLPIIFILATTRMRRMCKSATQPAAWTTSASLSTRSSSGRRWKSSPSSTASAPI